MGREQEGKRVIKIGECEFEKNAFDSFSTMVKITDDQKRRTVHAVAKEPTMFIIYGWKGKPETISQGNFFCPACQKETWYDHQQMRTWGTLFFIPIIPMAAGSRYIQCRACQGTFVEAILNIPALEPEPFQWKKGDRILGKRDQYWYPGTVRGGVGNKLKVQFDDGTQSLFSKTKVIELDLQIGDPVYARANDKSDFVLGNITAQKDDSVEIQFENGKREWTKLSKVRVIWEDNCEEEQ